jgi:hypothetical protein
LLRPPPPAATVLRSLLPPAAALIKSFVYQTKPFFNPIAQLSPWYVSLKLVGVWILCQQMLSIGLDHGRNYVGLFRHFREHDRSAGFTAPRLASIHQNASH